MSKPKRRVVVLLAFAMLAAGCSDSADIPSTTVNTSAPSADDVVFSSGEIPETIPAGFPIPAGSAVGSTMVVTKTGFTEVILRISAAEDVVVQFYEQGLAQAGFTVVPAVAIDDGWLIEFSDDGGKGTIEISEPQEGISQAVVRYNVP